jgi:hypothetical protein
MLYDNLPKMNSDKHPLLNPGRQPPILINHPPKDLPALPSHKALPNRTEQNPLPIQKQHPDSPILHQIAGPMLGMGPIVDDVQPLGGD